MAAPNAKEGNGRRPGPRARRSTAVSLVMGEQHLIGGRRRGDVNRGESRDQVRGTRLRARRRRPDAHTPLGFTAESGLGQDGTEAPAGAT
ncbi:hypothetical protein VTN02DRAFT_3871 [Thermoascus thermophilus]